MPDLYLFGGPNGAGKTTIALKVLPALGCEHFVNADMVAAGLSPLNTEEAALQAGVLMMKRVWELAANGVNFGSESTLAARSWVRLIKRCQESGYRFNLFYIWLPSVEIAIERVASRVRSGGHDIPEETIRRRYIAGLQNFKDLYLPLADRWTVLDNTFVEARMVAQGKRDETPIVLMPDVWERLIA
jgi:predicted ABC-type ATPase